MKCTTLTASTFSLKIMMVMVNWVAHSFFDIKHTFFCDNFFSIRYKIVNSVTISVIVKTRFKEAKSELDENSFTGRLRPGSKLTLL